MRQPPAATSQHLIHMSPPLSSGEPHMSSNSTTTCNPRTCSWRPYSNSNDFETNAAMVLIILFCALICFLALNAAIRCFLRDGGGRRPRYSRNNHLSQTQQELEQRKPIPEAAAAILVTATTLVYSTGMKLPGAEAECAICLSEFVEGEGIQVLAKCKHGFHVQCIRQWLSSHYSCPTCRCSCLSPSPSSDENIHQCVDNSSQTAMPEREP
ncbi:RING-H2 finger protein ATL79-like [Durio zibethinus]|uniref:RING-type E3 ubiquitin transferase n=1 Tax=Durio zibethinus TaxID=66656 RepID=A0A6P5YCX1_DURZI|nr:RING-H2 finger protein ATL79-like [Durio zibethinus]